MEYLQSESTNIKNVSADLLKYLIKLVENKHQRKSDSFAELLIYSDTINGEVYFYWYDSNELLTDDNTGYAIEFPELFKESNKSPEGSFYFDEIISKSVYKLSKSEIGQSLFNKETILYQDEIDDPKIIS